MKKNKSARLAICTAIVFCMTCFACISAFADNNAVTDPQTGAAVQLRADKHKHYLEDAIIKLVQEGKLSKEKSDRILEYKKKRAEEFSKLNKEERSQIKKQCKRGSLLKELRQEGIITDTEAQLIRAKLHEMKEARLKDGMQGLVDRGVLTPTDIDNIRSYMLKVREERKVKIEKLGTMTPEERKAYFKENKEERKDILSRMVEDKVITIEQADEIRKAVPELNKTRFKNSNDNH